MQEREPPRFAAGDDMLVAESGAMRSVLRECAAVASLSSTLLMGGETGVGKSALARAIHALSDRAHAPFVQVDCAALSPHLVESELFGHERGAFTGAVDRRAGRLELARDGTLLLDEIGELDLALQGKLLRVLQEREYERLGGVRTQRLDARVIAATNVDLRDAVRARRFRADLYFRIAVIEICVPPLRERRADIPRIARDGLARICAQLEVAQPALGEGALARLVQDPWPGNVRQLLNVLERLAVRARGGRIEAQDVCDTLRADAWLTTDAVGAPASGAHLPAEDAQRIAQALRESEGNISRAARLLGVPRTTLRHRMARLGVESAASVTVRPAAPRTRETP